MGRPDFETDFVTTDVLPAYDTISGTVAGLAGHATQDTFDNPTPCADWDVRQLLCHLVFINQRYAGIAERREHPLFDQPFYLDPIAELGQWTTRARAAFSVAGFESTVIATPIGRHPGRVVVQHVVNDLTAHAWDLARALHRPTDFLPGLAKRVLASWQVAFAHLGDPPRNPATIDTIKTVRADSSPLDRLAAFLGRDTR